jgi:hypothetical protein
MESILLVCALAIAVIVGYQTGKWSREWEMSMLRDDNIKLTGEVHMLQREIDKADTKLVEENYTKNIKELEEIKWD